jgi:pyruvate dehydrogenase E2 component (dihydrolipoamide acetyltransferase)
MSSEVKLPELGENLEGGEVLDVRVKEGDTVKPGQPLLEVEAEKSTVEVPSPVGGKVSQLLVKRGDKITVGQTVCVIEDGAAGPKKAPVKATEGGGIEPEPPHALHRNGGAEPRDKTAVAERLPKQPSKPAPRDGHRPPTAPTRTPEARPATPAEEVTAGREVAAGPATRRLARELGVDLRQVTGTARGGRITPEDVKVYVRETSSASPAHTAGAGIQPPPLPDFERWGPVERKPLEPVRRRTADQMSLAWNLIPHVTQHDLADITDLDSFRRQQQKNGPKLTVTVFALKAAAVTLKQFPQFNSSLDLAKGQLVYKRYYHLGVAVDTERGLLVPVIRDVDKKGIRELAQELADVAERARQKKLPVEEMRGGTFTITNLGGIGGTAFTPIVNYPEVAILGLSRGRLEPVVRDGQIVPRLMLPLSLSYDHRVIDGADAARFTRRLAELLADPRLMLL